MTSFHLLPGLKRTYVTTAKFAGPCRSAFSVPSRNIIARGWRQSSEPKESVAEVLMEIPGKGELLSPGLKPDVRKKTVSAVEKLGYRVTTGDVAAAAGITLAQAESALHALANDSLATLQVSPTGEILYVFSPGFNSAITARSLKLRAEPAFEKAAEVVGYVTRVAFGTALIASLITTFLAITAITSSSRDRDDRGRGYYPHRNMMMFNITDMFWYWDPWYYRRRAMLRAALAADGRTYEDENEMNFFEAVFSFVFGDGDPNLGFDGRRWESIGKYIRYKGGVVAAEEIAPFLDLPAGHTRNRNALYVDESYMLPVLARLRGEPKVDESGRILYYFPALQQIGSRVDSSRRPTTVAAFERPWKMTAATGSQQTLAILLGTANFIGVYALGRLLAIPSNQLALIRSGMGWVMNAMPFFGLYAAAFFAIPLLRWLLISRRNAAIQARNNAREEALTMLQRPDPELRGKLARASEQAQKKVFRSEEAVFRTDREALDPREIDNEAMDFERKMKAREGEVKRGW